MKFSSKEEICIYFNIDASKTKEEIIKELKQMQASIHPDKTGEQTEEEKIRFSQIDAAKKFLRGNDTEIMVPLSDIRDILSIVKNNDTQLVSFKEKIEERIQNTSQRIIKTTKGNWKTAKITSTSIAVIITAIWAFPAIITEHPVLSAYRISKDFYLFLAALWFFALFVCCSIWLYAYNKERKIKNILETLKNEDNQFAIFSNFLENYYELKSDKRSFTVKDIEEYIEEWICYNKIGYNGTRYIYPIKVIKRKSIYLNKYFLCIKDIIPEVSQMIITRALEKEVILKEDKRTWYDRYIINDIE